MLSVSDAVLIGALVGSTAGPLMGILAGVAGLVLPWLVLGPVTGLIFRAGGWGRLVAGTPRPDKVSYNALHARSKLASVFVLRRLPINNFTLVAADDDHLLLAPALTIPVISPGVMIPWEMVEFITTERDKHALVQVKALDVTMRVPIWACEKELAVRRAIAESAG